MKKQPLHPDFGTILASGKREGSLIKRAMICRTGQFWGMNGPVTVTREMLEGLAQKYKAAKAKPQNEHDFAPILIDHIRVANNTMGRCLADGMEVGPWKGPDGIMYDGLFADLRVDDEEARQNVESGKFAQLSISFDEESLDFYEVSFVAVPAAQGSIILSKGGKKVNYQQKLQHQLKKHNALAAAVRERTKARQTILSGIVSKNSALKKDAVALEKSIKALSGAIKLGQDKSKADQLKERFSQFVKQGKIEPAELEELNFVELSAMPKAALKALEKSYASRQVSEDVVMHGQSSPGVNLSQKLSPKAMREAIALQQSGQKPISELEAAVLKKTAQLGAVVGEEDATDKEKLGEGDEEGKEKLGEGEDKEAAPERKSLGEEDWKAVQEHLADCHAKISACLEKIQGVNSDTEKLSESDKDQDKELGDDDDAQDMGGDDEKSEKLEDGKDDDNKLGDGDESSDKEEKE